MNAIRVHENPARLYLDTLAEGSRWSMRQALESAARFLSDGEHGADTFPWSEVRYRHTAAVRSHWVTQYKPATVNKLLAGLRGVLKQTWRLGLMDAETYRRAAAVDNVRGSVLPRGRAVEGSELRELFGSCAADASATGHRDAALLAVLYGTGMRRAELAGLDLDDFDPDECSIRVRNGKRRKERTVYLSPAGCDLLNVWIHVRGSAPGSLFCPVRQTGEIPIQRLRGESIGYILKRRQQRAGVAKFSAHDCRRTFVSSLLESGVDVFTVHKLAGHAEPTTTARYDRRGEAAKKRAAQSLCLPVG
ncbi:MAG: site-specific integrase [Acidobacteriota bacterium]